MRFDPARAPWQIVLALLAGLGLGLAYSWLISPTQYVDASPSILRADFKDQYRAVVAASYASTHDIERARARLALLGDADPVQSLSAQAQRMLAAGESFESVRLVAQLATDLQQGVISLPATGTSAAMIANTPTISIQQTNETPPAGSTSIPTELIETPPASVTSTPRPTHTPIPPPAAPFSLVGQDEVCDPDLPAGLLQIFLMDRFRVQAPGIEITVTWNGGEDSLFTGFKPEVGDGYADFQMEPGIFYSVRVEGGTIVPNISIPNCTDSNGQMYLGGVLLTFQQP
jgi:hypothetical protein